jgi:hypothetical protein
MSHRICVGNTPADWLERQFDEINDTLGYVMDDFEAAAANEDVLPTHLATKINRTLISIRTRAEKLQRLSESLISEV